MRGFTPCRRNISKASSFIWSPAGASWGIPILPGGYLLGVVLLINLIAAHATRFQLSKKKAGIICLHLGVILLLIGQLLTGLYARETQMRIDEGQTLAYSEAAARSRAGRARCDQSGLQRSGRDSGSAARARRHHPAPVASLHASDQTLPAQRPPRHALPGSERAAVRGHQRRRPEHRGHGNAAHGQGRRARFERGLHRIGRPPGLVRHVARLERDLRSASLHPRRSQLRVGHAATAFSESRSRSPCSISPTIFTPAPISRKTSPAASISSIRSEAKIARSSSP